MFNRKYINSFIVIHGGFSSQLLYLQLLLLSPIVIQLGNLDPRSEDFWRLPRLKEISPVANHVASKSTVDGLEIQR